MPSLELPLGTENKGSLLLGETEEAIWRERHQTLSATRTLTGLFRGWVPEKFAAASCRILYVGKATSNSFEGLEPGTHVLQRIRNFLGFREADRRGNELHRSIAIVRRLVERLQDLTAASSR